LPGACSASRMSACRTSRR